MDVHLPEITSALTPHRFAQPRSEVGFFAYEHRVLLTHCSGIRTSTRKLGIDFHRIRARAYITRNLTIHTSLEEYVTAARAKGLPEHLITRRYTLRPSLPPIITSISFATIASLQGSIVTETIFGWPGIGRLLAQAIRVFEAPVVIGIFVIYAYLIVITVFILDVVYGFLDPRIKVDD